MTDSNEVIGVLESALRECANDLEAAVEAHYSDGDGSRIEQRRYERDIEPVKRAREALARLARWRDVKAWDCS